MSGRPLTVVHVFGAMDRGGAELRTLELIERLEGTGIRSMFVTLSGRRGSLAERFEAVGAVVLPMRLSPAFPVNFVRFLRSQRADVVHSHVATFSGAILWLARIARVKRRIAHFRSDGPPGASPARKRLQYAIMRAFISRNATDIVGVSPGALTHGWRPDWERDARCRVIPSGIDLERFACNAHVLGPGGLVSFAPGDQVVVHVGRGVPLKNRERALTIFAGIAHAHPRSHLAFVGADDSESRARWQETAESLGIANRVAFLGERGDVPQILKAAHLLLLTSQYEGLPGVVLEATAAGTPVLASDLPGVRFIAAQVEGIEALPLDAPDSAWVSVATTLLGRDVTPRTREAARVKLMGGIFDLSLAVPRFATLWGANVDRGEWV